MQKSLPIIKTYEDFVEYTNELKYSNTYPSYVNIDYIDKETDTIKLDRATTPINLGEFLYEYVTQKSRNMPNTTYISSNIEALADYDFMQLYARTYPDYFKEELYAYAKNLITLGEKHFKLFDFDVEIVSLDSNFGLSVTEWGKNPYTDHIEIPFGITEIGEQAFSNKSYLKKVSLPSSLKKIGNGAFYCSGLTRLVLPDTVESIGAYSFSECDELEYVNLPLNLKSIGVGSFKNTSLSEICIPPKILWIEAETFENCNWLKEVTFPNGLKGIHTSAFNNTILESIELPDSVEFIKSCAFAGCRRLKNVKLSKSLNLIDDYAFGSAAIETIDIPDSIIKIGNGAFYHCRNLKTVNMPKHIAMLGENIFEDTPLEFRQYCERTN